MARQVKTGPFMGDKGSLQRRVLVAVVDSVALSIQLAIWGWDIFGNPLWMRKVALVMAVIGVPVVIWRWAQVFARLRALAEEDKGAGSW